MTCKLIGICLAALFTFGTLGHQKCIAADASVKVGISAPLTGDLAEYGTAIRNGIDLAKEQTTRNLSNIDFIFEDNQYSAEKSISAFYKLKDLDKVSLIYNWGEPPLHAIAQIAESAKFPIVAMSLDPAPSLNRDFIIRSINHSAYLAQALVRYFRSKSWKRIAVIKTEDPFLNSMIQGIRNELGDHEQIEVVASFNQSDLDFKPHISKLNRSRFDGLGVFLFSGQISTFYRQAAALRLSIPTFGTDFFESRSEISLSGGKMNGAIYANIDVPASFRKEYMLRYGNDSQIAYAYNAFIFAVKASQVFNRIERPSSGEKILELFMKANKDDPFKSRATQDGGRFYEFPVVIRRIEGNQIVTER